jgi:hypothetical protein
MKRHNYSSLGFTPKEDGSQLVYEIDWDYIHERLAPRAERNASKSAKIGPIRVRVIKNYLEPRKS